MPAMHSDGKRVDLDWPIPAALKAIMSGGLSLLGAGALWMARLAWINAHSLKGAMPMIIVAAFLFALAYATARMQILVVATPQHIFRVIRFAGCRLRRSRKHFVDQLRAVVVTTMVEPGKYAIQSRRLWAIELLRRDRRSTRLIAMLPGKDKAETFARPLAAMTQLAVEYAPS